MLAGEWWISNSWLENADLLREKEAKSQVANACPSLAKDTFRTWVCLSWDEDTMGIYHPLDLKETAGSEKGGNIFNSLNSAMNISIFFCREYWELEGKGERHTQSDWMAGLCALSSCPGEALRNFHSRWRYQMMPRVTAGKWNTFKIIHFGNTFSESIHF